MNETDKKRLNVLNSSLGLENATSVILGYIFNREEDYKHTLSFGNKSTSLSFNQKMFLLIDYGAIVKEDKFKFDTVMNIRNQFLHNQDCKTYQDACNGVDGLENKLKKIYGDKFNKEIDIEKSLENCFEEATYDCLEILITLKGGIKDKLLNELDLKFYKSVCDSSEIRFEELANDITNDKFDFQDKFKLIEKLSKLKDDIFDFSKVYDDLKYNQDLLVVQMREKNKKIN